MHDAKFRDFVHWCQYQHRQHLAGEDTRFWRYIEKKVRPRANKAKKTARAGDSSDEDDSSGSEIMSGDEAVMGAGGAAGALYVPLAKQRAPRATTSRFAEGRPTKKAMQPEPEPEPEPEP